MYTVICLRLRLKCGLLLAYFLSSFLILISSMSNEYAAELIDVSGAVILNRVGFVLCQNFSRFLCVGFFV